MVTKAPSRSAKSANLSADDMLKVFELLQGSTSVEVKVVVPDESRRVAVKSLGFDPVEAQPRQAYFFDTPDLALSKAGIVVRARRFQGGKGDTVVKLRPVDPATLDHDLRRVAGFKIELDAMPGGYVCSASYKGLCTGEEVLDVAEGKQPIESIFSKEQLAFYADHAPAGLPMEALVSLGPVFLLKAKYDPKGFDRPIIVELWLYPDGTRIFEISTKGSPDEAFQVGMEFRAYLNRCGIPIERMAATKTGSALDFFSKDISQHAG